MQLLPNRFLGALIRYQVFIFNTYNLHTVERFQVFLTNGNNFQTDFLQVLPLQIRMEPGVMLMMKWLYTPQSNGTGTHQQM